MSFEDPKPPDDEKKENKKYKRVPVYTKQKENIINQPEKQFSNTQKEPNKNIGNPVLPVFLIILTICGVISFISNQKTPEQIRAEEQQRREQVRAEEQQRKIVEVNDWYMNTSQFSCEDKLKEQLRDPNSYERDKDFTFPTDNGNEKIITWEFRSKNGFGGFTNGIGMCAVSKKNGGTVNPTILGQ